MLHQDLEFTVTQMAAPKRLKSFSMAVAVNDLIIIGTVRSKQSVQVLSIQKALMVLKEFFCQSLFPLQLNKVMFIYKTEDFPIKV